ncbi:hypothetical protein ACX9YW_21900 [Pseudoneobacillus sp. C159]
MTSTNNGKGHFKQKRPLPNGKGLANNGLVANKAEDRYPEMTTLL